MYIFAFTCFAFDLAFHSILQVRVIFLLFHGTHIAHRYVESFWKRAFCPNYAKILWKVLKYLIKHQSFDNILVSIADIFTLKLKIKTSFKKNSNKIYLTSYVVWLCYPLFTILRLNLIKAFCTLSIYFFVATETLLFQYWKKPFFMLRLYLRFEESSRLP